MNSPSVGHRPDARQRRNPTGDPAWVHTEFSFPAPDGGLVTWQVEDVLDTVALGYEYESTAAPSGVTPAPVLVVASESVSEPAGADVTEPPVPQMLGATTNVALASREPARIELAEPA